MVADHNGGIGAKFGGDPIIGGGSPAQGYSALLTEIIPAHAADIFIDRDVPGDHLIDNHYVPLEGSFS